MTQDRELQNRVATRFSLAPANQLADVIDWGMREIGEALQVDQAAVFLLTGGGQQLVSDHAWYADNTAPQTGIPSALSLADLPCLYDRISSHEVFSAPSASALPAEAEAEKMLLQTCGISSLVAVPMCLENALIGVMAFGSLHAEKAWTKRQISGLKHLAEVFAVAHQRKQTAKALAKLALGTANLSGNELYEELVRNLASVVDAHRVLLARHVGVTARVLALWIDGEMRNTYDYSARNTPCGKLNPGETVSAQSCGLGEFLRREDRAATRAEEYSANLAQDRCLTLPLTDATGRTIGHLCVHGAPLCAVSATQEVVRAFADRVASELQRERSEIELRVHSAALSAAADAVVITEPDGSIRWANPAFFQLSGYSENEIIGQNMRILKSGVQPDDFYADLWKTITAGKVWQGELKNRRKSGEIFDESMTVTPVKNQQGRIANFIAIKQDTSERKRKEREHDRLIAQTRQAEKMEALGRGHCP